MHLKRSGTRDHTGLENESLGKSVGLRETRERLKLSLPLRSVAAGSVGDRLGAVQGHLGEFVCSFGGHTFRGLIGFEEERSVNS
jgi:hypothetical protein